jgi:hypothetical protein
MKKGAGRERRRICHFEDCVRTCVRGFVMCPSHKSAGCSRRSWEIVQRQRGNNPKTGEPKEGWVSAKAECLGELAPSKQKERRRHG